MIYLGIWLVIVGVAGYAIYLGCRNATHGYNEDEDKVIEVVKYRRG